jgi:hypothetical protein
VERDEEELKETKMNKINNLDGQLKLSRLWLSYNSQGNKKEIYKCIIYD